jgi:TatD DNase family protein
MPTWFDTHAHLDDFAAAGTLDAVLARAAAAGVTRICAMGGSPSANALASRLAAERPATLVAAVGLDRDQSATPPDLPALRDLAQSSPATIRAIGEIGLDYYYDPDGAPAQRALFTKMLELALDLRLPVCVHTRDADADTLAALREFSNDWKKSFHSLENFPPPGILHCYTRGPEMAEELLDLGFYISFSGILSFNNAAPLRELASHIPSNRLLVETDSPYLAPKPFRGKTCEPMYTARTGEVLAEARSAAPADIAAATTNNAFRVFRIQPTSSQDCEREGERNGERTAHV